MKIELTPEQYRNLVEMAYLGEWTINAWRQPKEIVSKYDELLQHIFSHAREGGLDREINYDEVLKKYFPSREFEMDSDIALYRHEFEEEIFWEELVERLSLRDATTDHGESAVGEMGGHEQYELQLPFMERYNKEFEKHGIERLHLVTNRTRKK